MALNNQELEALKKRLEQLTYKKGEKKEYPKLLLKLKEGTNKLRMVPYPGQKVPLLEMWFHYDIGRFKALLCPRQNNGKDCPLCEFAFSVVKENKELAKKLFAKMQTFAPVVDRTSNESKVLFWGFGPRVYKELLSKYILEEEYDHGEVLWNPEAGLDLTVEYTPKTKTQTGFAETMVKVGLKKTVLASHDKVAEILTSVPKIEEAFMPVKDAVDLTKILNDWMHPENDQPKIASEAKQVLVEAKDVEEQPETQDWSKALDELMAQGQK